jgi:hypothetical protein
MIDREAAGRKITFFKKANTESSGKDQETIGISNKAKVYFVIVALILILCVVYVEQLRTGKGGGQNAADAAAQTTAETAAQTQEETPAAQTQEETPAAEAEQPAENGEEANKNGQ